MTTAVSSPFRGKPTSGEGGSREIPSADAHEARCVALIDLGTHEETFQGSDPRKTRKVYVVWELDERLAGTTNNHLIGQEFTLSWHEKAGLRHVFEAVVNGGQKAGDEEIDYEKLLGAAAMVTVAHQPSGDRTFARVAKGGVGVVPKSRRDKVFSPGRRPTAWYMGEDLAKLPDWLPWYYGAPVAEKIRLSDEMRGPRASAPPRAAAAEGEAPGASKANEPPF